MNPRVGQENRVTFGVGVRNDEDDTEAEFGGDIQNTVNDSLSIDRQDTSSLTQTEDDGVGGPQKNGKDHQGVVSLVDLVALKTSGSSTVNDESVENVEEESTGDSVKDESVPLSFNERREQSSQDHTLISDTDEDDRSPRKTSEESEIEEEERGGDGPVDVSSIVNFPQDDMFVITRMRKDRNESLTHSSSHDQVRNHSSSQDDRGEVVEQSKVGSDSFGSENGEDHSASKQSKHDPKDHHSRMSHHLPFQPFTSMSSVSMTWNLERRRRKRSGRSGMMTVTVMRMSFGDCFGDGEGGEEGGGCDLHQVIHFDNVSLICEWVVV